MSEVERLNTEINDLRQKVKDLELIIVEKIPALENELVRLRKDRREMELYLLDKIHRTRELA